MKQLAIISGKGGTGKTSLCASFAILAKNKVIVDCDVDAADLYLLLKPKSLHVHSFSSGKTAAIDSLRCTRCGLCAHICRFEAIQNFKVEPLSCEGCGFCSHVCPVSAISLTNNDSGRWIVSSTDYGLFIYAKLNPGEENSGKLVAQVRREAFKRGKEENTELIIIDGPPGTGCPVISSIAGVDGVLIVTEPTMSGLHDLERIVSLVDHFGIETYICVNKWDINEENFRKICDFCISSRKELIGEIPFDQRVHRALNNGITMCEISDSPVAEAVKKVWETLYHKMKEL